jgi:hypothetical protein
MTEKQKVLYESASDLWYTLHEDNEKEDSRMYLIRFLKIELELLQSFNNDQLESKGKYKNIPISHNSQTGQDVAFSIISVLSLNADWINKSDEPILYEIFWLISLVLTHPLSTSDWNRLFELIKTL